MIVLLYFILDVSGKKIKRRWTKNFEKKLMGIEKPEMLQTLKKKKGKEKKVIPAANLEQAASSMENFNTGCSCYDSEPCTGVCSEKRVWTKSQKI